MTKFKPEKLELFAFVVKEGPKLFVSTRELYQKLGVPVERSYSSWIEKIIHEEKFVRGEECVAVRVGEIEGVTLKLEKRYYLSFDLASIVCQKYGGPDVKKAHEILAFLSLVGVCVTLGYRKAREETPTVEAVEVMGEDEDPGEGDVQAGFEDPYVPMNPQIKH
jgi:phage anti-repressor protein